LPKAEQPLPTCPHNTEDTPEIIDLRPFDSLGAFRNERLNAHHHFSFGGYPDPARMGLGRLRVCNDDEVAPGTGFDPHPHRDVEIITYIRQGAITHRDNLGTEGRTEAGDVQVMHAGTGITHAEYNLEKIPTRLFQIWIMPDRRGVAPRWDTRTFPRGDNGLSVLASGRPEDASSAALKLNADAASWPAPWPRARPPRLRSHPAEPRIWCRSMAR
jgi:redox-sensitive bicupin YhaK (pirin superfamily)